MDTSEDRCFEASWAKEKEGKGVSMIILLATLLDILRTPARQRVEWCKQDGRARTRYVNLKPATHNRMLHVVLYSRGQKF